MVSNQKKRKKKIYDCTKEEDYFEYREIVYEKYQHKDLDTLKHIRFMVEARLNKKNSIDLSIMVTLQITVVTNIIGIFLNNVSSYEFYPTVLNIIFGLNVFAVFYITGLYGVALGKRNKEHSMLKLEKQVLEELIVEKSKPHKFYNEFF